MSFSKHSVAYWSLPLCSVHQEENTELWCKMNSGRLLIFTMTSLDWAEEWFDKIHEHKGHWETLPSAVARSYIQHHQLQPCQRQDYLPQRCSVARGCRKKAIQVDDKRKKQIMCSTPAAIWMFIEPKLLQRDCCRFVCTAAKAVSPQLSFLLEIRNQMDSKKLLSIA